MKGAVGEGEKTSVGEMHEHPKVRVQKSRTHSPDEMFSYGAFVDINEFFPDAAVFLMIKKTCVCCELMR